jgi:hypothetical protein
VIARGQESAILAVDRVGDLLAAQLVEAQLAHLRGGSTELYRIRARPSSLLSRSIASGPIRSRAGAPSPVSRRSAFSDAPGVGASAGFPTIPRGYTQMQ